MRNELCRGTSTAPEEAAMRLIGRVAFGIVYPGDPGYGPFRVEELRTSMRGATRDEAPTGDGHGSR